MGETEAPNGPPASRALAQRITTRLYGAAPALRWIKSDEVDAYVASFGAVGMPDKVIKLDRPGRGVVAQERRLLPYLRGAGVDVPTVEHAGVEPAGEAPATQATPAPAGAPGAGGLAFSVQPFLERRGIGTVYAEDPPAARAIAARLGRSVARLHALPVSEVPGGAGAEAKRYWVSRWWRGQHERFGAFLGARPVAARLCARALEGFERLPTHFGNGQWYQCRFDGRGAFAIIDWGTCGVLWPLYDLAMALWAARAWCRWESPPDGCRVSRDEIEADLVPRVLTAYLGGRAQSPAERDELALWRAYLALMWAAEHHEKGNMEKERDYLAFVERILAERPGALG